MFVKMTQTVPMLFAAVGAEPHKYVVFAQHAETGLLVNTLEEALHLGIIQADVAPAAVADQVMVRRLAHQFVDPATSDFITMDQAITAEGFQRAVEGGAADARLYGLDLLVDLVEGGVLTAAPDGQTISVGVGRSYGSRDRGRAA